MQYYQNKGYYEQHMNKAAENTENKTKEPQTQKNNANSEKYVHILSPSLFIF